ARALCFHGSPAPGELLFLDEKVHGAAWNVDRDRVAFFNESDRATLFCFRRDVPNAKPGGAAGEASVGDKSARLPKSARLEIAGRIEHFLHAGAAARPLVANDDDVARRDLAAEDSLHRVVLALEDACRALELENAS